MYSLNTFFVDLVLIEYYNVIVKGKSSSWMKSLDNILHQLVKEVKHICRTVKEGMGKMRNDKPYFKLRQQLFALGMTQEEL